MYHQNLPRELFVWWSSLYYWGLILTCLCPVVAIVFTMHLFDTQDRVPRLHKALKVINFALLGSIALYSLGILNPNLFLPLAQHGFSVTIVILIAIGVVV